jgi:hypothetical protein
MSFGKKFTQAAAAAATRRKQRIRFANAADDAIYRYNDLHRAGLESITPLVDYVNLLAAEGAQLQCHLTLSSEQIEICDSNVRKCPELIFVVTHGSGPITQADHYNVRLKEPDGTEVELKPAQDLATRYPALKARMQVDGSWLFELYTDYRAREAELVTVTDSFKIIRNKQFIGLYDLINSQRKQSPYGIAHALVALITHAERNVRLEELHLDVLDKAYPRPKAIMRVCQWLKNQLG